MAVFFSQQVVFSHGHYLLFVIHSFLKIPLAINYRDIIVSGVVGGYSIGVAE